jgi:hypothetical protein
LYEPERWDKSLAWANPIVRTNKPATRSRLELREILGFIRNPSLSLGEFYPLRNHLFVQNTDSAPAEQLLPSQTIVISVTGMNFSWNQRV